MRTQRALSTLLTGIECRHAAGPADAELTGITSDSRQVQPGECFVAIRGTIANGHAFVPDALARGAAAVIVQEGERVALPQAPAAACYAVHEPRRALGDLARAFHGQPDSALTLVAVTGTNGKTTTTHLVRDVLESAGRRCGLIGTIAYETGAQSLRAALTTPDAVAFFALLAEMRDVGLSACAFEASSHALDQERLGRCEVDVAAFSNVTREHLDYHASPDAYLAAKLRLLDRLAGPRRRKPPGRVVVNGDDPILGGAAWPKDAVTVGRRGGATVRLLHARYDREGTQLRLDLAGREVEARCRLLGPYNAENLLLCAGIAHALGLSPEAIAAGLEAARVVAGRMEPVALEGGPLVLVDYAHTPDGMAKALAAARALTRCRLLLVFGCGGDRDRGKRPLMAEAAAAAADLAILTLDNPRTEDPQRIFQDAERGFIAAGALDRARTIPDRGEAIAAALAEASPQDVVLVAGKGHETYQIVGSQKLPWDDRAAARAGWASLRGRAAGGAAAAVRRDRQGGAA